ncbi:MAG: mycofactocin system GMC family oxidoreductase MftG [Gemmatimonadetes bacterium]|nr:mycofactocin system GMC family oxidoreductase MftG [Gemmatimonadota bacterium]
MLCSPRRARRPEQVERTAWAGAQGWERAPARPSRKAVNPRRRISHGDDHPVSNQRRTHINATYDTVIIGAGSAGCVLASRLTEDESRSVLLIEGGPDFASVESLPDEVRLGYSTPSGMVARSYDWGYEARTGVSREPIIRGKLVGGSSAVNAQIYLWGLPYDFDRWVALGNDTWSWNAVEPYFRKVETDQDYADGHGQDGPIPVCRYRKADWLPVQAAFHQSCLDRGFADCPDLNKPYATGIGPYPMNNPDGIRVSTAIGYLNPVRSRPNLTIFSNTEVERILLDANRATGLTLSRDGEMTEVRADNIIVAAGAIGSPLLLQRSGVGDPDHLNKVGVDLSIALPGVGQNLRDHPAVPMYWEAETTGPLNVHWHQVGLRYTAQGSSDTDDMIVYVAHVRDEPRLLMRPTVNLARSNGHLAITSPDPAAKPEIDYRMFDDPYDRERMREAIRLCRRLVEHPAFEPHVTRPMQPDHRDIEDDQRLDAWILAHATTGHHVSGTCKMGPASDPHAVVDQNGAVHGVEGLRVIDASIFPDCVRANIHATVLMMAERLSDQ